MATKVVGADGSGTVLRAYQGVVAGVFLRLHRAKAMQAALADSLRAAGVPGKIQAEDNGGFKVELPEGDSYWLAGEIRGDLTADALRRREEEALARVREGAYVRVRTLADNGKLDGDEVLRALGELGFAGEELPTVVTRVVAVVPGPFGRERHEFEMPGRQERSVIEGHLNRVFGTSEAVRKIKEALPSARGLAEPTRIESYDVGEMTWPDQRA